MFRWNAQRIAIAALIATLAIVALALAGTAPAAADDPPGFNGTTKVHAGDSESEPIMANEPHVGCTFHIHGFKFDAASKGSWRIVAWPPTGDGHSVVVSGSWTADASGEWRTAVTSLADGHYKVLADQDGAPGGEKHKVFWVECAAGSGTPAPTATAGNERGATTPAGSTTGGTTGAAAGAEATAATTATPAPGVLGEQAGPQMLPSTATGLPGSDAVRLIGVLLGLGSIALGSRALRR